MHIIEFNQWNEFANEFVNKLAIANAIFFFSVPFSVIVVSI